MLQRFLRRDHEDPYLDIHRDTATQSSLYDDAEKIPLLQQRRTRLIAGGALAVTVAAVLFSGSGKDGSSIPTISAPTPTTRIKPADPQGLELPNQDMQVYSYVDPNGVQQPKVERLIPAPQDTPKLPPKQAAPAPAVTAAPVASPATPFIMPPSQRPGVPGALQPVATQPAPPVTGSSNTRATAPMIVAPAPVAAPPQVVAPQAPANVAPPAAVAPAAPVSVSNSGTFRLQLGSLRDMAAAQQHWKTAQTRGGATLSGVQPQILKVEIPGKGTYFRVQAGSWPSRQDAQQTCDSLKQARVDCMVVR